MAAASALCLALGLLKTHLLQAASNAKCVLLQSGGADMTPCPADSHFKSYFWQKPVKQLFFALTGKSACAALTPYIFTDLAKDLDLSKDFKLGLFGSMQDPVQLQYTVGAQSYGWNLTSQPPAMLPEGKLIAPEALKLLTDFIPVGAQCDMQGLQQECKAMCTGLATTFQPVCPNGQLALYSAESIVCGFTQMSGSDSKCLDACQAVECVQ